MNLERRSLVKLFGATPLLLGCGAVGAQAQQTLWALDPIHLDESIKAGFGGSFSVRSHVRESGLVYAEIEHCQNRYLVASADLFDWQIVSASLHL